MPGGKKEKIRLKIEYVYPDDFEEFYATGVRLLVNAPHHVMFNFFWDKMQDDIAEEVVVEQDKKMKTKVSKRTYEQGHVKREFVASVTMSIPNFKALLKIMTDLDKGVVEHEPEKE